MSRILGVLCRRFSGRAGELIGEIGQSRARALRRSTFAFLDGAETRCP